MVLLIINYHSSQEEASYPEDVSLQKNRCSYMGVYFPGGSSRGCCLSVAIPEGAMGNEMRDLESGGTGFFFILHMKQ